MIRRLRLRGGVVMAACAALLAATQGCGGGGGGGTPSAPLAPGEAAVHGTVRVAGKPATGGKVTFTVGTTNVSADIGKDGSYSLKTRSGPNTVSVSTPETDKDPKLRSNSNGYSVSGGDNTIDVEL